MKSVVLLQARTNSSRLPAKVLLPINDYPLVVLAAKRAANRDKHVVVATSLESSDDELAAIVRKNGFTVFRGSLDDVLSRTVQALGSYDGSTIVFRLTADNVFPDGSLLQELEVEFIDRNLDYLACNGEPSGLPYGVSVEVTYLKWLREADRQATASRDREHVTPYLIRKFGQHFFTKYRNLQKGHYRCTIDCLDDYFSVSRIFSDEVDPIGASFLDLIEKLDADASAPTTKQGVSRFVLGTAQLGLEYGISNLTGQPSFFDSKEIIKTAIVNGARYIDTANAYGSSESVIGRTLQDGWQGRAAVITKLSPLSDLPRDATPATVRAFVDASIYASLAKLQVRRLDGILLHRALHLRSHGGAIWDRLIELKAGGVIDRLGISVQTPLELADALLVSEISIVQMPFNILDWRWSDLIPVIQEAKKKRPLEIHVRSGLLQGLLTTTNKSIWRKAGIEDAEYAEISQWLESAVFSMARRDTVDLALAFLNSMLWIDGIVIGVENKSQLLENLKLLSLPPLEGLSLEAALQTRPTINQRSLDPAYWSK